MRFVVVVIGFPSVILVALGSDLPTRPTVGDVFGARLDATRPVPAGELDALIGWKFDFRRRNPWQRVSTSSAIRASTLERSRLSAHCERSVASTHRIGMPPAGVVRRITGGGPTTAPPGKNEIPAALSAPRIASALFATGVR